MPGEVLAGDKNQRVHVHVTFEQGRPVRVAHVSLGGRLERSVDYVLDPSGRPSSLTERDGRGVLLATTTIDHARQTWQRVLRSGRVDLGGCRHIAWRWDPATRTAVETCLNAEGRPAPDAKGVTYTTSVYAVDGRLERRTTERGSVTLSYDEEGRLARELRDTVDEETGCAGTGYDRDATGLVAVVRCLAVDGSPRLDRDQTHARRTSHDPRGCPIRRERLGPDMQPVATPAGVSAETWQPDAYCDAVEHRVFGVKGEPQLHPGEKSAHVLVLSRGAEGQVVRVSFRNAAGAPTRGNACEVWQIHNEYDARGRRIREAYLGRDDKVMFCGGHADEWSGFAFQHDEEGQVTEQHYLVPGGGLRKTKGRPDAESIRTFGYNDLGYLIEITDKHEDGTVISLTQLVRDQLSRRVEIRFLDPKGQPYMVGAYSVGVDGPFRKSRIVHTYRDGRHVSDEHFDVHGRSLAVVDCARKRCYPDF